MSKTNVPKKQSEFDEIIQELGNAGLFQKRFTFIFVSCFAFLMAMQYMTKIITLAVPNHWCHVPGRENTNFTLEEWKNITIPIEVNAKGIHSYSKCTRFANALKNRNDILKCDNGWEYDHTWYDATASIQNDWVCDNRMIPTNVLAINRAAEMIGTMVFGHLSDNVGRMRTFYVTLIIIFIGRITTVFTSSWVYVFYFFSFIGSVPSASIGHCTSIIAMEMSAADKRALIGMMLGFGWTVGEIISPLFMWWQKDWITFSYITTLPYLILIFSQKWMIESPRWLVSRGRNKRCIKVLKTIAKANKTQVPDNIEALLIKSNNEEGDGKIHTIFSLLSSARLAKNMIILVLGISVTAMVYMCLVLSANNVGGNPFLYYMFMGLVNFPVFFITKYVCDRYGRRFLALFSLVLTSLGCLTMAFLVQDPSKSLFMTIVSILTKGTAAMTYTALKLQVIEICPTCVRQIGASFLAISANSLCIFGPYIVALGISVNLMTPYFIYATCALLAFAICLFLPETLGHHLPETLDDAAQFGANQDFWGKTKTVFKANETIELDEAEFPLKFNNK